MWLVLLFFVVAFGVVFFPSSTLSHSPPPRRSAGRGPSRKNTETCLWLQRLLAASMDALATTDHISRGCRKIESRLVTILEDRCHFRNVSVRLTNVGRSLPRISTINVAANSSNPCSIEAEVDLEYDGGGELTFHGVGLLAFRRALSVQARVSKLSFSCRARVQAEIRHEGLPECVITFVLDEEPHFHCDLQTTVGDPLKLKNSWLVTSAVRYGLLFLLRRRMIDKQGISFTFPVGQEWNDIMPLWDGAQGVDGRLPPSAATSEVNWPSPQPLDMSRSMGIAR